MKAQVRSYLWVEENQKGKGITGREAGVSLASISKMPGGSGITLRTLARNLSALETNVETRLERRRAVVSGLITKLQVKVCILKGQKHYNRERPHQGLGYRMPDEVYYDRVEEVAT